MHLRLCWRLCFLVESRVPFMRPVSTEKYKSNFKIGPMTLFTHLKIIIILLQCLQFLIINNIQTCPLRPKWP